MAVRNIRRDAIEEIRKLQKDGLSEDLTKDAEKSMQEITDQHISLVEKHLASKEREIYGCLIGQLNSFIINL
ncbi:MAG: ribosome-recycling factor [Puia sp.]